MTDEPKIDIYALDEEEKAYREHYLEMVAAFDLMCKQARIVADERTEAIVHAFGAIAPDCTFMVEVDKDDHPGSD